MEFEYIKSDFPFSEDSLNKLANRKIHSMTFQRCINIFGLTPAVNYYNKNFLKYNINQTLEIIFRRDIDYGIFKTKEKAGKYKKILKYVSCRIRYFLPVNFILERK